MDLRSAVTKKVTIVQNNITKNSTTSMLLNIAT